MELTKAVMNVATLSQNDTAWAILYGALLEGLGLTPQNFQLIYPMTSWNWPTENRGFTSGAQYDFCSIIPQWSAVGAYVSSGDRYNTAYQQFLNSILPPTSDPTQQAAINAAQNNLTQANSNYQGVLGEAQTTYSNTVTDNNPSFTDWLQTSAGLGFAAEINSAAADLSSAQSAYNDLVTNTNLSNALAASSNHAFYTQLDDSTLTSFPPVPGWSIALSSQQWLNQVQGGGGTGGSISFGNSDAAFDYSNTWAQGSTSVGGDFWSVFADGSWQQVSQFLSDSSLTCTISFAAWDTISITPSDWYSGTNVFRNGPFKPGVTATQAEGGSSWMFGEGGLVPMFKSSMLVCYQPTITISVSQATFDSFQQQWSAATGIQVGPFRIGGSSGGTALSWSQTTSGMSTRVVSTSTTPLIFGVEVALQPQ
jgi:hypothetical protein